MELPGQFCEVETQLGKVCKEDKSQSTKSAIEHYFTTITQKNSP